MRSLRQFSTLAALLGLAALPLLSGVMGCAEKPPAILLHVGYPDLQSAGLQQVWERGIDLAPGESIANAWRVGDSVYVATNHAALIRIDATSGVRVWEAILNETSSEIHRPAETSDGKSVVVVNRGNAYVLEKRSGSILERNSLRMTVTNDPVVRGNVLALGGMDSYRGLFLDGLGGQIWITHGDNDVFMADPAVVGDSILIASHAGKLWRINLGTGDWAWKDRKTNGEVIAGLTTDGRYVYVPAMDHRIYAFDQNNGGAIWDTRLEGTLDQPAVPLKTQLLIPTSGKGLYSLTTDTGDIKWLADGVSQVGTIDGNTAWCGDAGGNLVAVALDTGTKASITAIPYAQIFVRNPVDQLVIMVNRTGVIAGYMPIK